jgi:hypothetical protein
MFLKGIFLRNVFKKNFYRKQMNNLYMDTPFSIHLCLLFLLWPSDQHKQYKIMQFSCSVHLYELSMGHDLFFVFLFKKWYERGFIRKFRMFERYIEF